MASVPKSRPATKRPRTKNRPAEPTGFPDTLNVNGTPYEIAVERMPLDEHEWRLYRNGHILAVNVDRVNEVLASEWLGIFRKAAREASAAVRQWPDAPEIFGCTTVIEYGVEAVPKYGPAGRPSAPDER
jgi:hypothetical protein